MSLLAKMKGLRRYCGVEPVVFFYSYWYFLGLLAVLQYVYYRFSEDKGFPYRNLTESGEGCGDGGGFPLNSSLHQLEIEVQSASSELYLYYLGVWALSISFIVPFTGSYTDRRGRKPGLIAPLVGAILETLVLLLVLYLELPVYVLIVGGLVNGLTGNEATMMMATTCYVTDTTDDKQKAFRLSILQGVLFFSATVSQLTSGLWIEYLGFRITAWFEISLLIVPLVYVIFFVEESRTSSRENDCRFFSLESIKPALRIFTKAREEGRGNFLLLIACFGIVFFSTVGTFSVFALFVMRTPLCWGPGILGYFMAYKFLSFGIGAAVGLKAMKWCGVRDINLCRVALLGQAATLLTIGFADATWIVFLAPAVGILGGMLNPVLWEKMSTIVGREEQGSLFATIAVIQTLMELTGTLLFNTIYPESLRFGIPGFVFFLSSAIMLIPFAILSCIHFPEGHATKKKLEHVEDVEFQELSTHL
ncbi:proton-coupled folate transporter isoform X1 [Nematostella vectensis]|uniref:proton-coupled folate transporter isoform X1 n=1 Tax=Nematostella vectensis TaxID=45351 RepID=UPI00207741AA|nr:proton-coupled folate transporter isoform X1 [Nematostella vectensis]XP_048582278.1 proton-coupled folate transporter isoform X1 [Nematostella vectensis]